MPLRLTQLTLVALAIASPSWPAAESLTAPLSSEAVVACTADSTTLCLNGERFSVNIDWTDFQGNRGTGKAVPFSDDSGLAYFFDRGNIELLIKVLDGCGVNGHFWVFFAATTDVAFNVEVIDTATGAIKTYSNALRQRADAVADTSAFATCSGQAATVGGRVVPTRTLSGATPLGALPDHGPAALATRDASGIAANCAEGPATLCLNAGRFEIEVDWRDFQNNRGIGQALKIPGSSDSGLFYFFEPGNLELLIKVLDGCSLNDRFWVFFAATTTVEFTVTVTDTLTGAEKSYTNPLRQPADAVTDTSAFDTCDGQAVPPDLVFQAEGQNAVTATIPVGGGSLETTGNDGTRYRLELGAGSLPSAQQITLTPLAGTSSLLDGGVTAARLGPDGLRLVEPATLTLEFPSAKTAEELVGFVTDDDGRGLYLVPSRTDALSATLEVAHFSSAGVGSSSGGLEDLLLDLELVAGGLCTDLSSLSDNPPGLTGEARGRHRLAVLAAVWEFCGSLDLLDDDATVAKAAEILRDWFIEDVRPLVERAETEPEAVLQLAISRTNTWLETLYGYDNDLINDLGANFDEEVWEQPLPPFSCGRGPAPCMDLFEAEVAAAIPILRGIKQMIVFADRRCQAAGDDDDREALDWIDLGEYLVGVSLYLAYARSEEWERDPDPTAMIETFKPCGIDELRWELGGGSRAYMARGETAVLEIKPYNRAGDELPVGDPLFRNLLATVGQNQTVVEVDGIGGGQGGNYQRVGNAKAQLTGLGAGQESVDAGLFLERTALPFYSETLPVTVFDFAGTWRVTTTSTTSECEPGAPLPPPEDVDVSLTGKTLAVDLPEFGKTLRGDYAQPSLSSPPSFLLGPETSQQNDECDEFFADICAWTDAGPGCGATPQFCEMSQAIEGTLRDDGVTLDGRWGRELEVRYLTGGQPPQQATESCEEVDTFTAVRQ